VAAITLIFFQHTEVGCSKVCPVIRIFICAFNTTLLHYITFVKYLNGCSKIILDAGLVTDVKLHAHLNT
jgi:hypothetical protein